MQRDAFSKLRERMVREQLVARRIADPCVLEAMRTVPRHLFVPKSFQDDAYADGPLPIDAEQTISQPYVVAFMAEAVRLTPNDRVLEIGTGSGYAAAVMASCCKELVTVERIPLLKERAQQRLQALGYENVHVVLSDGSLGWEKQAPYDAIVVTAGSPEVPEALVKQLAVGGRMVIPVGPSTAFQELMLVEKTGADLIETKTLMGVRFVPLIGKEGFAE